MTLKRNILALSFVTVFLMTSCLIYDNDVGGTIPAENTWVSMAQIPQSELGIRAVAVNGKIYVIGGSINSEYDPATNNWTAKTPMPTPRNWFGITVYQNKIYTVGGRSEGITFGAIEVYDPMTDTWKNEPDALKHERCRCEYGRRQNLHNRWN